MMKVIRYSVSKNTLHIKQEETRNLKGIKEISLHKKIVKLDAGVFRNQQDLLKVYFEKDAKLTIISESAFENCINLKTINLSDNIITIEKNAFKNCKSIKEIKLPFVIKDVHPDAFHGWTEDQIIYTPYKLKKPITCKATIIIDNPYHQTTPEPKLVKKKGEINYYLVTVKCGHVGRDQFMPITFPVKADSKKEASEIVRQYPRVKRDHKDFVMDIVLTNLEDYEHQILINNSDPYLHIKRKKEQNEIIDQIIPRLEEEKGYLRKEERFINKYKKTYRKMLITGGNYGNNKS